MCKYTPQHNGVVERKNRTIAEVPRTMLDEKYMSKSHWAEAVSTAVYLMTDIGWGAQLTPHEVYFGRKINMTHIRVFGHMAYVHVPKEKRKKLNTKAEKCILIVYSGV